MQAYPYQALPAVRSISRLLSHGMDRFVRAKIAYDLSWTIEDRLIPQSHSGASSAKGLYRSIVYCWIWQLLCSPLMTSTKRNKLLVSRDGENMSSQLVTCKSVEYCFHAYDRRVMECCYSMCPIGRNRNPQVLNLGVGTKTLSILSLTSCRKC